MQISEWFQRAPRAPRGGTAGKKPLDREGTGRALQEERIGPLGVCFCLLLCAAVAGVLDYGVLAPSYALKLPAPADIRARLSFQYSAPEELNRLRDAAGDRAPRVYVENPAWMDGILRELSELIEVVEASSSEADARDRTARYPHDFQLVEALYKYKVGAGEGRSSMSGILLPRIRHSLQTIAANGVLSDEDWKIELTKPEPHRIIRIPLEKAAGRKDEPRIVNVEKLSNVTLAIDEIRRANWRESLSVELSEQLFIYLRSRMVNNLKLDLVQSNLRREGSRAAVRDDITVNKGDLILTQGQIVRQPELDRLHEEYAAYKSSIPPGERRKHLAGLGSVVLGVLLVFILVAHRLHPKLLRRRRALLMLGLFSLATLLAARALLLNGYSLALTPFAFLGIVASLAFGQSVALATLLAVGILVTFAGVNWVAAPVDGGIPVFSLVLIAGGIAAAIPAERLRDRWDLLKYGAAAGLVQGALAAGLSLLGRLGMGLADGGGTAFETALQFPVWPLAGIPTFSDAAIALANGPLCGLLVLGSLPLIESFFGILTNIKLFELADLNQPALRRLQLEAPGTFAHTLQVRFLADSAADAIGANTRLVSAGVLYHDLGKIMKSEYFVENDANAGQRHARLRPSVSALLITAHVKDGIELAREYGLPRQIIDFIPEHHGTTLVQYFFHSAQQDAESEAAQAGGGGGKESVQEAFFRYPGPKPRTRETAIVMLADTVEAATRTLDDPSAARLKVFVHELVTAKMLDGQLDECSLTFKDLAMIEEAFLRVLVTRFHSRVRYPEQEEERGSGAGDRGAGTTTLYRHPTPDPRPPLLIEQHGKHQA